MAPGSAPHAAAARLRMALLALTATAMLGAAWALLRGGAEVVRVVAVWEHHDAVLIYDHLPETIELEVHGELLDILPTLERSADHRADVEGHARVLLPRPHYLFTSRLDLLPIAHDPADPVRVRVLDIGHLGLPLLAQALLLAVLGWVAHGLARSDWGEDRSWVDGRWLPTATQALRPGSRARAEHTLLAPAGPPRPAGFWIGLFGLAAAASAWLVLRFGAEAPVEVGAGLAAGTLALAALSAGASGSRTRHVRFDDDGIADGNWFATRRLPWKAVASLQPVNINREEQERYDRTPGHRRPKHRMRPPTIWQWVASDAQGRELLRLPCEVEDAPAFAAFAERCGGVARRMGRMGSGAGLQREEIDALGAADDELDDAEDPAR
ncbi:MAG: hypothetical protein KF683_18695 [Rubrivivax sp.]|nr:hypothetical protein [Rubrivivax sp.]